jgi:hypothetical protein
MAWTWHRTQAVEGHRAAAVMAPLFGAGRGLTASSSPILPCLQTARPKGCISAANSLCTAGGCCSQAWTAGPVQSEQQRLGAAVCVVEMQWLEVVLSEALVSFWHPKPLVYL